MLNRVFVGLAIVATIFVAAFGYFGVKPKLDEIVNQRDTEKANRVKAENDLARTRRDLKATQNRLKDTETKLQETAKQRDNAIAERDKQAQRANQLADELKTTRDERDQARGELAAWKALGLQVNEIAGMIKNLQDTKQALAAKEKENQILDHKRQQLQSQLDEILKPDYHVVLPENIRGKVLAVDPKWNFVVLNFGENAGALKHGELLVDRGGQLIAKVRIESLQADRCIANVEPGFELHNVLEGDTVFPVTY